MYMQTIDKIIKHRAGPGYERGGLTIISAVLVLILMTSMVIYATRVGILETRVSANEVRQKAAFHAAEAAVSQGLMYLLSNADVILSSRTDAFADGGVGTFEKDGWLAGGSSRKWQVCPGSPSLTHPCGGAVGATTGSWFYDTDQDASTFESMPIDETGFPTGVTTRMTALLCFVNIGSVTCDGSTPSTIVEESNAALVLTLLAYGYSDCTDTTDIDTCTGQATVAFPIASFRNLAGMPAVPLTVKSTLPLQGTFEVVPNPNGGGVGVPLSVWSNNNATCGASDITSSGSWQTCELQEWYGLIDPPPGVSCSVNTMQCQCSPGNNVEDYLSYRKGGVSVQGIDVVRDVTFPCDLFETYFGVPKTLFASIKNAPATTILSNCSSLDASSSGIIWISADGSCDIGGSRVIGSPEAPVILISAGSLTKLSGTPTIFGVLYIFDYPASLLTPAVTAEFEMKGTTTAYGAVIVDAAIKGNASSTVQVVYNASVLASANGIAGLGAVNGGWRDFGLPDIDW